MDSLVIFIAAGLIAQLINGSLGMGYGVLTTSGLLAVGVPPAPASAAVQLSQVSVSLASGIAHWKFRNIDWRTVGILALSGAVGAGAGAYALVALSEFSTDAATMWIAGILLLLGLYVLIRFSFLRLTEVIHAKRPGARYFGPIGLVGGFINATGGGGWGPIATSTLLSSGTLEPRKVVGSVSAAELSVVAAGATAFLVFLGSGNIDYLSVVGLLIGDVIAAPMAAWLTRSIPPRALGAGAGGLIVLVNTRLLLDAAEPSFTASVLVYSGVVALWIAALVAAIRAVKADSGDSNDSETDTQRESVNNSVGEATR